MTTRNSTADLNTSVRLPSQKQSQAETGFPTVMLCTEESSKHELKFRRKSSRRSSWLSKQSALWSVAGCRPGSSTLLLVASLTMQAEYRSFQVFPGSTIYQKKIKTKLEIHHKHVICSELSKECSPLDINQKAAAQNPCCAEHQQVMRTQAESRRLCV